MKNLTQLGSLSLRGSRNNNLLWLTAGGVLLSGLAASLFLTESGKKTQKRLIDTAKKIFQSSGAKAKDQKRKLGHMIEDVREHIQSNAQQLVGNADLNATKVAPIHPQNTPTTAWKKPRKKQAYPERTLPMD